MENKLKMYDQELSLKVQSAQENSNKLKQANDYLNKQVLILENRAREMEYRFNSTSTENMSLQHELHELKHSSASIEHAMSQEKNKNKQIETEIDEYNEAN